MIEVKKILKNKHKDIECNIGSKHSHVDKVSEIEYKIDFGYDVLLIKNITELPIKETKGERCCDLVAYKKNDEKSHASIIIETKSEIGLSGESGNTQKISKIGDQLQCGYHKFKILLTGIKSEKIEKKFIIIFERDLTENTSLNKENTSKRDPRKRALNNKDKTTMKAWRNNELLCTNRTKYPYHSSKIQIIKVKHVLGQYILLQNI